MKILCRHFKYLLLSNLKYFILFVWFDSLCLIQQFFSHAGTGFPGLKQYQAADKVSCSRTQHSDSAGGLQPNALPTEPLLPTLI